MRATSAAATAAARLDGHTIVFDLDGTLVETAPDLIAATNHVLGLAGLGAIEPALIRPFISFGARSMIREGLRLHGRRTTDPEIETILGTFLAHYSANIAVQSHPYPGLGAALDRIVAQGGQLAVCTNKSEALARKLLDALGLSGRFKALAGYDTFSVAKPHPEHLLGTIRLAGGEARRAIMVGDSETDIKTARAAGTPVIGVTFGYTDRPVATFGPDAVIDHFDHLDEALARVLKAG